MGWNACDFNEDEAQYHFPFQKEENGNNKASQLKGSNDFLSKFEQNLHHFGEYIDQEEYR